MRIRDAGDASRILADDLEAAAVGQPDVQDDDPGPELRCEREGLVGPSRLPHHTEAILRVEQRPEALPDEPVIIDDQHLDLHRCPPGPGRAYLAIVDDPGRSRAVDPPDRG